MDIMLDLETLDLRPTAVVTSIGAVRFTPYKTCDEFYAVLNPRGQQNYGRTIGADTVMWWLRQSQDARIAIQEGQRDTKEVLAEFAFWLSQSEDNCVWGNGSDFDNVILASMYRDYGMQVPWSFNHNRCFRTIKNLAGVERTTRAHFQGTEHNALHDARNQAEHLQRIWACLRSGSSELRDKLEAARTPSQT